VSLCIHRFHEFLTLTHFFFALFPFHYVLDLNKEATFFSNNKLGTGGILIKFLVTLKRKVTKRFCPHAALRVPLPYKYVGYFKNAGAIFDQQ